MIIYIFYGALFLLFGWHIFTGFMLWGFIPYKYRIVLCKSGLYQAQKLETFGWSKVEYIVGYATEEESRKAIKEDIQWYKNKREKRRQSKVVKVIPFMGEKIKK